MASQRLVILLGAIALVLLSVSQVSAVEITADYTLTVESDGLYEFSLPWIGASQWFLDGVLVPGFDVDVATGSTSGELSLVSGQTHSLHIVLIGEETPTLTLGHDPAVSVTIMPEPATLLLVGLGLAALAIAARRRARREAPVRSRM